MKYCSNCGTKNEGDLNFCSNCGQSLKGETVATTNAPAKKANGKAIASMILGIIAVTWAFISLFSFGNIEDALYEALENTEAAEAAARFAFALGFNILSLPCGIIGLVLGLRAKKNGKAISGIITSSIALLIALIACIIIFTV